MVENEISYLSWKEFRQMAPSVLQLEIRRLSVLIDGAGDDLAYRNALVKARYEVRQFVACLHDADKATVEATCAPHLQAALLALSFAPAPPDAPVTQTLAYVADRLTYVHQRTGLVY